MPLAVKVFISKSQEIWKSSIQKLSDKVLCKNVNFYKYICIYQLIAIILGKEERDQINY